jgi:hypothetical protein
MAWKPESIEVAIWVIKSDQRDVHDAAACI